MSGGRKNKALEKQLKNWRENASYMYERLDTIGLEWPALTAQWVPTDTKGERAFVASYTNGEDQEYVREVVVDTDKIDAPRHTVRQWNVPRRDPMEAELDDTDEVQKLRTSPTNPQFFAGISALKGHIYLWDTKSSAVAATLDGHTTGGFGLAWQPGRTGDKPSDKTNETKTLLASGADDAKLCLWEIDFATPSRSRLLSEVQLAAGVNDVTWDHPNQIVAACDDGKVVILAINADGKTLKQRVELACHAEGVNTAALSPFAEHLLVTGSSDSFLRLWDTRRPTDPPLYENQVHTGRVNVVKWSPHLDGVFASAGMGGVVLVWNIHNVGQEQTEEDAEDGPPELMFNHSGHISGEQVQDLDWHPSMPFLLLSADENNTLMSWRATNEAIGKLEVPKMPNFLI